MSPISATEVRSMSQETALQSFASAEACETAFYEAFREGDLIAMQHIWSGGTDVVCIHPARPPISGRRAVMQSWQDILDATGGVDVRFECRHRARADRLAVHIGIETIGTRHDTEPALVTVTNVYELTEHGWKMEAHHAGPIRHGSRPRGPMH
jgi:ketosteroid isomerase-like protein